MPESEFLRQKREREFQARMLAVTERRARPVLSVINSPFFLWLLSAVFITIGGAYFSTRQQCIIEAEKIAEQYEKIGVEIERRQGYIHHTIATMNSASAIKKALSQIREHYSDFHSRPLFELIEQREKLLERIDTSPFGDTKRENDAFLSNFREELKKAGGRVDQLDSIFRGEISSELNDGDVEALKYYSKAQQLHLRASFSNIFKVAEPACTLKTVMEIAATGQKRKFLVLSFDFMDTFTPDEGFTMEKQNEKRDKAR